MKKELKKRMANLKAVIFDADGVLFSGKVLVSEQKSEIFKERSLIDGQGISLLRSAGIRIAFITGEKSGFLEAVGEKLNNLHSVKEGVWPPIKIFTGVQGKKKVEVAQLWLNEIGIAWEECAAMGDDLSDYYLLQEVGVAFAPAQAEDTIKKIVHYVTPRQGGEGAIRDLSNLILSAKGIDPVSLSLR